MDVTRALLVLTLGVALVAASFAIWPVVADAPWEDEPEQIERVVPDQGLSHDEVCTRLYEALAQAQFLPALRAIQDEIAQQGC